MTVNIAQRMAKRRLVKDLSGNIIDWYEEGNGGWIVRGREVVNAEKWEEIQQKKRDEALAAQAVAMQKIDDNAPDRTVSAKEGLENLKKASEQEKKVEKLEKKVTDMDNKMDTVIELLKQNLNANPKIFYLPGGFDGCYYYRGFLPGTYSNQLVCSDFIGKQFETDSIRQKIEQCDVLVVQRPSDKVRVNVAKYAKKLGKKIIFENDDTYLPDKGVPLKMLKNNTQRQIAMKMNENLYEVVKMADGIIASTPTLAEEYKETNPNVAVCKNCIDPLDEFPCKENTTGKFRIGFIGSVSTNDDYLHIKDQIKQLDDRGDITIVVFGIKYQGRPINGAYEYDYSFWNSLKNVEWQPFVHINEYMMTVANLALDLAVIPRKESYFNQCKSNLKFLEMSLLKIPVIAQGFSDDTSPYDSEKDYMTVVKDNSQWYNYIVKIKDNYQDYKKLAEKAHDYVLENYNIESYAETWTETIKKLINKK